MNSASQQARWVREANFPPYEALALRQQVTVLPGALRSYVRDHGVSESLARAQLLDLVEEAAVRGDVSTRPDKDLMRLTLPQRVGRYHVMIDSRTLGLFAYSNLSGARTWMEARTEADRASAAAAQLKEEQRAAKQRRKGVKTPCLTWSGHPAGLPANGNGLRVWRQLRQLDVAIMVCRTTVRDCVYFATVPDEERLAVIRGQLEFVLARVSEHQVSARPDGFTIVHGPIAWHIRRDGRLLEQVTVQRGRAEARFAPPRQS
ncbi:hypothetical protein [Streptomyces sp. NBC_00582]|uniref:hypothetical protein n=1 Tax=Streptomyces sp. NBC_00582 TaxID=2975783 RepID=UPI002E81335C|nr:hypothetical protein [Streptomyces sp. NBC_00582]WUB68385.1 hypothetical protein OG852_49645 [Streptomyces sp. NBC_00582]